MTTNTNVALAQLRHLYANMMGGEVRDTAQTKRMAQGLLAPAIEALEQAALTTAAAVPPEGWVMVPVEPTEEMKAAAVKYANGPAVYKNLLAEVLRIEEGIYGEVYEAMLAARPGGHP